MTLPGHDPSPDESFGRVLGAGRGRGCLHTDDGKLRMAVGDRVELVLPASEVCMHLRVAGHRMTVELVADGGYPMAQLYDRDGRPYSSPILPSEGGLYVDEHGYYANFGQARTDP